MLYINNIKFIFIKIFKSIFCCKYFISLNIFIMILVSDSFSAIVSTTSMIEFDINNNGINEFVMSESGFVMQGNLRIKNGNLNVLSIGGAANLNINGTYSYSFEKVSSDSTLSTNSIVFVDTSMDNIFVTLPDANLSVGKVYEVKKTSANNYCWLVSEGGSGNKINDSNLIELGDGGSGLTSVRCISDGEQWYTMNESFGVGVVAFKDIVGWWKLDELSGNVAIDYSLNNNYGYLINSSGFMGNVGVQNKSLFLDGIDDQLVVGDIAILDYSKAATWSFYMYFTGDNSDIVISKDNSYEIQFSNVAGLRYSLRINNDTNMFSNLNTVEKNSWVHVAITWELNEEGVGDVRKLYINGLLKEVIDSGLETSINNTTSSFIIGGRSSNLFSGFLDDVRVYKKSLSAGQVYAMYLEMSK